MKTIHELRIIERMMRAELASLKAQKRAAAARQKMFTAGARLFAERALADAGLDDTAIQRIRGALGRYEKTLLNRLGKPLPGNDALCDTCDVMRQGYRSTHQTIDDMLRASAAKAWRPRTALEKCG